MPRIRESIEPESRLVCSVVFNSLQPHGLWPTRFLCPWNSPGKNTRVGCYTLLQRIFGTQGSNPHLLFVLHCRQILSEPSVKPHNEYLIMKHHPVV